MKNYVALLNQSGFGAPLAEVCDTTLDGEVQWSRVGVGQYLGRLVGAFAGKVALFIQQKDDGDGGVIQAAIVRTGDDTIEVVTPDGDSKLSKTSIDVRVYG